VPPRGLALQRRSGIHYLNPSPLLAEALILTPGTLLELHYRVGPADPLRLVSEYAEFPAGPVPPPA